MKCPKCLYIGFETGDRCKNCGYDFSLLGIAEEALESAPPELPLRQAEPAVAGLALDLSPALDSWTGPDLDRFRDVPEPDGPAMTLAPSFFVEPPPPAAPASSPALPLFSHDLIHLVRADVRNYCPTNSVRVADTWKASEWEAG